VSWTVERWGRIPGLAQSFGGRADAPDEAVRTLRQVHGARVLDVEEVAPDDRPEADGLVTRPGAARVGVWTADCVPVHLVAERARIAAAVHAGWRGTAAGVVDAAIAMLRERFGVEPSGIEAALGPAIGGCCYEIGDDVREAFRSRYGLAGTTGFIERAGKSYLDLRIFLVARLSALGVAHVEMTGPCTGCRTDLLYSYRKEGKTGRQLSAIGWVAE
jgi:YfiH family protein